MPALAEPFACKVVPDRNPKAPSCDKVSNLYDLLLLIVTYSVVHSDINNTLTISLLASLEQPSWAPSIDDLTANHKGASVYPN